MLERAQEIREARSGQDAAAQQEPQQERKQAGSIKQQPTDETQEASPLFILPWLWLLSCSASHHHARGLWLVLHGLRATCSAQARLAA
jgi:hypothetical protein